MPYAGEGDEAPTEKRPSEVTQIERVDPPVLRASERPGSHSSSHASSRDRSSDGTSGLSLSTPRETLLLQEIGRTRVFMRLAIGLAISQLAVLALLGGDPFLKNVFVVSALGVVVAGTWMLGKLRDDAAYTVSRAVVTAYVCIAAAFAGIAYYGVFSPAAAILPFGLFFFSTGQHARATQSVLVTCLVAYAALGLGVASGMVPDRGLVTAAALGPFAKVVVVVVAESVFIGTYAIARATRSETLEAIARHDVVLRSLAQRDALLKEARQDLAQAMRVGGIGRYTGEVVGPYRLGKVIGRGAMGEVYEARATVGGGEAAVKLLHAELLADEELVQRFFREAEIVGRLRCPNVVQLLESAGTNAPVPYLAMELLHGEDLAEYLRAHKRMPMRRVLTMLRQVGVGLDAARAAGVVHRDLKPRNLFLAKVGAQEIWKILDFGVSKLTAHDGTLTQGAIVGTPANMAPEQAAGEAVDHRADLFALGVIAYRALTGRPPFAGDTSVEILYKVVHTMPPRPSDIALVGEEVELVLAIALAKSPGDRFDSAAELAQALDAASRGRLDPAVAAKARSVLEAMPWGYAG
jgi:eukaryotic-like serine/threonine-protein kinase